MLQPPPPLLQTMIYDRRRRGLLMFVSRAIALQSLFVAALFRAAFTAFFFVSCHHDRTRDKRKLIEIKITRRGGKGEQGRQVR